MLQAGLRGADGEHALEGRGGEAGKCAAAECTLRFFWQRRQQAQQMRAVLLGGIAEIVHQIV